MQTTQKLVRRAGAAAVIAWAATTIATAGCGGSSTATAVGSQLPTQLAPTSTPTASPRPSLPSDLDRLLAKLAESSHAGAIARVASPEKTWRGAAGQAGDGNPPEPTARFGIASDTKTFTATIVL